MSDAPVLPLVRNDKSRSVAYLRALPGGRLCRSLTSVGAVEIVAPDRYCAQLLVDHAPPAFRARIMPGAAWIVRLESLASEKDWVVELLSLVEEWLQSSPQPCAKVRRGDRSYLVRAPNDFVRPTSPPSHAA